MDKVIEAILKYGLVPVILLIAIFLIVQDPNRAFKLKSAFISPFFKLFKWFKRAYVANEVSKNLNTFFQKELGESPYNFKINWIKNESDPFYQNGSLVIKMKREEDQAKNILTATKYALPKVICPIIRHNILPAYSKAIDFAFLHKLADKLGNHGKAVFKKYFLNPQIESDSVVLDTLQILLKLDKFGVFTTIFINELDYVGEGIFADSDTKDRTQELTQFINYLNSMASREIGEEIQLEFHSDIFKVSTIFLAKSVIANKKGLIPYLRRLNLNLERGSDSIYIIAFPPAFEFLDQFIKVVDGNQRVSIQKVYRPIQIGSGKQNTSIKICSLRRNKLYTNETFVRKIEASDVKVGRIVEGTVLDCSRDESLISFCGLDGTITSKEVSWFSLLPCTDVLHVGEQRAFIVKAIDKASGNISLSLRLPENDPWLLIEVPSVGEIIEVIVKAKDNVYFKCIYKDAMEVLIPNDEISWEVLSHEEKVNVIDTKLSGKVILTDEKEKLVLISPRQVQEDPWPTIHEKLKVGTTLNGKVHEVNEHFVRVNMGNGLIGKIPKENLIAAGHEYANYMGNLVVGQGIDVVVTKVFINKRWIRLDLKRNLDR